jgi:predicted Zn-ribbon and HTH transcriptional regulator
MLGIYPHKKVHIKIEPNSKPVPTQPYPVPRIQLSMYKHELDYLCDLGVLIPQQESEWASPSFIIPKKDGSVRWISNLRQLNKAIKRKQYPLPVITDILCKRIGYKFFTKHISMQDYTFELDEESQNLCTIITPFGKYKYTRLPMGLKCSPDIAQSVMENVLSGIDAADVYINDVGAFSSSRQEHLALLDTVLCHLCNNGFTVDPLK